MLAIGQQGFPKVPLPLDPLNFRWVQVPTGMMLFTQEISRSEGTGCLWWKWREDRKRKEALGIRSRGNKEDKSHKYESKTFTTPSLVYSFSHQLHCKRSVLYSMQSIFCKWLEDLAGLRGEAAILSFYNQTLCPVVSRWAEAGSAAVPAGHRVSDPPTCILWSRLSAREFRPGWRKEEEVWLPAAF